MLKAPWGISEGWDTYIIKAFSGRFGFDALRTSQIQTVSQKTKQWERPMGCNMLKPILNRVVLIVHIHHCGAFSVARF